MQVCRRLAHRKGLGHCEARRERPTVRRLDYLLIHVSLALSGGAGLCWNMTPVYRIIARMIMGLIDCGGRVGSDIDSLMTWIMLYIHRDTPHITRAEEREKHGQTTADHRYRYCHSLVLFPFRLARAPTRANKRDRHSPARAKPHPLEQLQAKGSPSFLSSIRPSRLSFVCVSVHHHQHDKSQPPTHPPPPPRHRSLFLHRRHIIPHHRSFCHYSRAPTTKSIPLFASTPPPTHAARRRALIRPRAPPPQPPTTTPHASTSSSVSLSLPAADSTSVSDKRTSLTSQPHHYRHRVRTVKSLLPAARDPPSTSHLTKSLTQQRACTHHTPAVYFQTKRTPARLAPASSKTTLF